MIKYQTEAKKFVEKGKNTFVYKYSLLVPQVYNLIFKL